MIRPAEPADLPRLRAIQVTALAEPWEGLLEPAIEGPPLVLVSTDDATGSGEPVGYVVAVPEDGVAYVPELAVATDYRGAGRGSALLERLFERLAADGYEEVHLTARADDERARQFYETQGFAARERLPDHYADGDGVLLVRTL